MIDLDALAAGVAAGGEDGIPAAAARELAGLEPGALLAALRASDRWRFVLYEIQGTGCAKAKELAALALEALGREALEEAGWRTGDPRDHGVADRPGHAEGEEAGRRAGEP